MKIDGWAVGVGLGCRRTVTARALRLGCTSVGCAGGSAEIAHPALAAGERNCFAMDGIASCACSAGMRNVKLNIGIEKWGIGVVDVGNCVYIAGGN